jgi:hypothetical protein
MLSSVVPSENAEWEVKEVPAPQPRTNQVLIYFHYDQLGPFEIDYISFELVSDNVARNKAFLNYLICSMAAIQFST